MLIRDEHENLSDALSPGQKLEEESTDDESKSKKRKTAFNEHDPSCFKQYDSLLRNVTNENRTGKPPKRQQSPRKGSYQHNSSTAKNSKEHQRTVQHRILNTKSNISTFCRLWVSLSRICRRRHYSRPQLRHPSRSGCSASSVFGPQSYAVFRIGP